MVDDLSSILPEKKYALNMIIFVVSCLQSILPEKKLVLNISIFWLSAAMMIWLSFFRSFSFTSLPPLDLAQIMIMQMQLSSFSFTSLPPQDQARKEGSCRFQSDAGQVAWWRFLNGDGDFYHTDHLKIFALNWPISFLVQQSDFPMTGMMFTWM